VKILTGFVPLLVCLAGLGTPGLRAQMVTVRPVEAPGPLRNPLMGFRPDLNSYRQYPYPTLVRDYIRWNQIENNESDTVQKIRDFCNARWSRLPADNVRVIPRVYIDWDSGTGNEYWPADLPSGDWSSQRFKDRVVRLVGRLGEVWDNDPRVAWVQTGLIGYWGEQENPVGVSQDGWAQRLGDAYTAAFKKKKLIVRNMGHWPGYPVGVYWDSFGHPGQRNGAWASIQSFNRQGRYLTQIVEGEVAYDWGTDVFDPLYGGEPTVTLGNSQYTDAMIDVIRELHGTALGWIASYKLDGSFGTNPDQVRANAARMQREFGYRFHLTEFSCSARTEPGAVLSVNFKVKNTGSAPFYEDWPVVFVLIDEATRRLVWRSLPLGVDIRTWHPGSDYSYASKTYQTPAREYAVSGMVPVPASLVPGEYLAGLAILEPMSQMPGVCFAVENFFKESQSQPLCRIGIGRDLSGSPDVSRASFNDPVTDDRRTYALVPASAPRVTLSPVSTSVVAGSPVEFTASASGSAPLSFQWLLDGQRIDGATQSVYRLPSVQAFHAGAVSVAVTDATGSVVTSDATALSVAPPPPSSARVLNLSTRALSLAGQNQLIPGFVLTGTGTKRVLVRAVGPGLSELFGIAGALTDPSITLVRQDTGVSLATNNDWGSNPDRARIIAATGAVGAFPLREGSKDAVMLVELPAGGYTVPTSDATGGAGLAIVELYDADPGPSTCRFVNLSNRGYVDVGEKLMIPGLVVSPEGPRTFLIRAVGPGLSAGFGVTGVLADPVISLFSGGAAILGNDDWSGARGAEATGAAAGAVGAFPLAAGSRDAAFVVTLRPGAYTVQVTGKSGTGTAEATGIVLVEVYVMP
jgi:hypothetical protein